MQTAIAHEMAHIERNKRPLLIVTFLLRIVHFFNPIALVEFRRIVQEEENICDDYAVTLTGKPRALADTLRKFHGRPSDDQTEHKDSQTQLRERLEEFSHSMIIESRITRLEDNQFPSFARERFAFALTGIVILGINYFIV
jgi:Zn-dependent protease with chaperone function